MTVKKRLFSLANRIALFAFSLFVGTFIAFGQSISHQEKRLVTVADAIGMTRFSDDYYFRGGSSAGRIARFSPDGTHFTITVKKGNAQLNTNEFSILLFHTADALLSPKPEVLLTMSSSSNRDGIKNVN